MSLKLFIIGDSISQGFMSGAAARPELSYGKVLSDIMGMEDYSYLTWDDDKKLKVDCEQIFRKLEKYYGMDINVFELPFVLQTINEILDKSEAYYERGAGAIDKKVRTEKSWFHNVAVEGMDVADAWIVTPRLCKETLFNNKYQREQSKNDILSGADYPFYRNARRVLNPQNKPEYDDFSALSWLNHHSQNQGIENTIIWLGANNALGTIIDLEIKQSRGCPDRKPWEFSRAQRQEWNLWHPDDFEKEYQELMRQVEEAMVSNTYEDWKVFIATIPYVTIAPLAKGMGELRHVSSTESGSDELKGLYYQYYSYFPLNEEIAIQKGLYLKFRDVLFIDKCISKYNSFIKELVVKVNQKHGKDRYYIVDICKMLSDMAWKRNYGKPTYDFPEYVQYTYPLVDSKYYHVTPQGKMEKGGLFSLDGVHPSAIGHGLIAHEFLKVMKSEAKLPLQKEINWQDIYASDSLYSKPIRLIHELYDHEKFISLLISILKKMKDK